MKFSLNWLNKYTNIDTSDSTTLNSLIDRIALQIVDVDERWVSVNSAIIDVDNKIITNRPYCFGHRGLAREISVMLNQKYEGDNYPKINSNNNLLPISVQVNDADLCPRFTAISIKNIKIGPSPEWLKNALEEIGQRSINNLVDITNYIMFDTAQPVHAYDYDKISEGKLIIRRATENETITTLDGIKRELNQDILLITDSLKPLGIAGVMGAGNSEIDDNTQNVLLEIASFNPLNIRKTAKFLKHRTDAVTRFEKGIDPTNIPNVMAYMVELILEICGGEVSSDYLDIDNLSLSSIRATNLDIQFDPQRVNKLLGFDITIDFIKQVFNKYEISYKEASNNQWLLSIPPYRSDVKESADLVEDIGRMYGYQNIPNITPVNRLIIPTKNIKRDFLKKARTVLNDSGLDEIISYSFISQKDISTFNFKSDPIKIVNPLSEEYLYLRPSLIPSLTKITSQNAKYFDNFGIFEIARKFIKKEIQIKDYLEDHGESMQPLEIEVIAMMYYSRSDKQNSIFQLKGVLENLMNKIGILEYSQSIGKSKHSYFRILKDGSIILKSDNKEQKIGEINLLENSILDQYEIKTPVSYLEIEVAPLLKIYNDKQQYSSFSKFPGSKLSYSILIPEVSSVDTLLEIVDSIQNKYIKSISITDIYSDTKTLGNNKSVSLEFSLQKDNENITDSEVYDIGVIIENKIKSLGNVEIRGGGVSKSKGYKQTENQNFIISAQILSIEKHPNADRLVITQVTTNHNDQYQIVTGASNIQVGDLVPVALPGTAVPGLKDEKGDKIIMKISKLRGIDSYGMMLAGDELGVNEDHEGIFILNKEQYKLGDKV